MSHSSTLFVSNLPYDATSTDLQTAFSDLAPVRSAFVVLEHGSGISKGVGYVSFSIKEDAQAAFESITANGMAINGRNVRVQWAESKVKSCCALHSLVVTYYFSSRKTRPRTGQKRRMRKKKRRPLYEVYPCTRSTIPLLFGQSSCLACRLQSIKRRCGRSSASLRVLKT